MADRWTSSVGRAKPANVNHFTWNNAIDCFYQSSKERPIVLDTIPLGMDDDHTKPELLDVVLKLKTLVERYQHVNQSSSLFNKLGIRSSAPS